LLVSDKDQKCSYWIHPLINSGSKTLAEIVRKFKPDIKIPEDPLYWKVYRKLKNLAKLGYVKLDRRKIIDWERTEQLREDEIQNSIQNIFREAVKKKTPPFISHGESRGRQDQNISNGPIKKITENSFHVAPLDKYFYLISRMQNSNQFVQSAKSRREWGQLKQDLDLKSANPLLGPSRKKCPYRLSSRTRHTRIDAVFRMRTIRRHSYFRRRDKKIVNPELVHDLNFVQSQFDLYVDDIQDLKCALVHKEDGHIKLIDYQTRFTDETRKDGVIARFYRSFEKANESFNTGVFFTLTSYPPSEAPKHIYRSSLWHVDRHFAVSWNAYSSKLTKRNRAARRDELLYAMREQVKKIRKVRLNKNTGLVQLTREERLAALAPMKGQSFRPTYLQVYEFQKNGMIHSHGVIFGKHWLDTFEQIKKDWQLTGQGEQVFVYGIHNNGHGWEWSKAQPTDSRNRAPVDYLMKYLGKGVRVSSSHGLYWAVNKRFFSNSQSLVSDRDLPIEYEKLPVQYEYLGSFKGSEIPAWLLINQRNREISERDRGMLDPLGWSSGPGRPGEVLA
jgi:hypothetical protein